MIILLSGQGEMIFPSDVDNVSQTVYTAMKNTFNRPPNFEKFNYLGTSKNFKDALWYQDSGKFLEFGGSMLKNDEITKLIDLNNRLLNIQVSESKEQSFYTIQNAIDVVPETGEVYYYDAQFMALNISQDTMSFLNSMNEGEITNKTEVPKWKDIEPLINGYARITKFAAYSDDHELKDGWLSFQEQFEGLYVDGVRDGFGRNFQMIGNDAYRCELGYFYGRALQGKGKVYFKLAGEDQKMQKFEGLYSENMPSWYYNKPVKEMTIENFEENELPK